MADETPKQPKPKRPWYRRIVPQTVAGRTAIATAVVLAITLIVVWLLRLFGPQSVRLSHAMTVPRMLIEVALTVAIPWTLYWGLSRWNQVIEGVFPDIDRAWQAGVDALEAQGIDAADYPMFLVLGSSDTEVEQGLMESLNTKLRVHAIPNTTGVSHALQWYLTDDAIYLFCPGASSLSALMGRWTTPETSSSIRRPNSVRPGAASAVAASAVAAGNSGVATNEPASAASSVAPAPTSQPEPYLGTIQFGGVETAPKPLVSSSPAQSSGSTKSIAIPGASNQSPAVSVSSAMRPAPAYQGTLSFGALPPGSPSATAVVSPPDSSDETLNRIPTVKRTSDESTAEKTQKPSETTAPRPEGARPASSSVALPAALDTSEQLPRLQYVCKLLSRIRRPRCGINGAVTLIPFGLSRVGPLQLSAISQSVRNDVEMIQKTLAVRAPVTAVLVGLEEDKGFSELVRRLQPGLLARRLGGRFDLRSKPTPEELNVHSDRLCDAFEDWVYRLFGREDALAQQRGNRKLYALVSRIRHELKPRLRIVLGQAFGCQSTGAPHEEDDDQSFFFSGCYFASSGARTGQSAFVQGVFKDKLVEEQAQVQWTRPALRRHQQFRGFTILGWVFAVVLFILLALKFMMP